MNDSIFVPGLTISLSAWGILTLFSVVYFSRPGQPKKKRQMLSWIIALFSLVFLAMAYFAGLPQEALYFLVPVVGSIAYLNYRNIRFCEKCGAFNPKSPGLEVRFCRSCGTSLEKTPL